MSSPPLAARASDVSVAHFDAFGATGFRRRATRAFAVVRRMPLLVAVCTAFLVLVGLVAVFGEWIAPKSTHDLDLVNQLVPPGSHGFLLGSDQYGRDILSRLIVGTRISLEFTVTSIAIAASFGTAVGVVSGLAAGLPGAPRRLRFVDSLLSGFVNITLSIPVILIALLIAVTTGYSFWALTLILVVFAWPPYAKVAREGAVRTCARPFVSLALVGGAGFWGVARRHILPALADGVLVIVTLQIGYILLVSATLDFLGVGVPPPRPTWGGMVSDGLSVLGTAWWVSIVPATAIALVVLAANTVGDWLREELDPNLNVATVLVSPLNFHREESTDEAEL